MPVVAKLPGRRPAPGFYKSRWGLRASHDPLSPLYAVRALTPLGERFLEGRRLLTPSQTDGRGEQCRA